MVVFLDLMPLKTWKKPPGPPNWRLLAHQLQRWAQQVLRILRGDLMGIILKEPWIPWKTMENYGKKTWKKRWKHHGNTMETPWKWRKPWKKNHGNEENHRKCLVKYVKYPGMLGQPWSNSYGKTPPWSNSYGKTPGVLSCAPRCFDGFLKDDPMWSAGRSYDQPLGMHHEAYSDL